MGGNKFVKPILWIIYLVGLFLLAKLFFKWPLGYSMGFAFGGIFFSGIIIHFIIKFKNRKKEGEPNAYVLPDGVAKKMKLIDTQVQYEASIMAMFFMMLGFIGFNIYALFFSDFSGWMKFFLAFNSFWGFIFMGAFLVTTFQQYSYYMETKKALEQSTDLMALPQQDSQSHMKGGKG